MTSKVLQRLEANHIHSVLIPESCTDKLQPMDVSVNKAAKAFLQREFQSWYAKSITTQKGEFCPLNLTTVAMKHIGTKWLVKMFEHISNNPHLVVNGFIASGISENISDAIDTDMVELSLEDEDEYDTDCEVLS
uniref:DDE-1 domain-containing protein n=1 Tax=Amphimedon queenslandica TaxID=400682 RepID=A0A1X7V329_AMPQE